MNTVLGIALCAVSLAAILLFFYGYHVECQKMEEKRREWAKLKEALEDEIRNGHNMSRIIALRLRVRKLEADISRW